MLERWAQGVDVVYGQRRSREGESRFKLLSAKFYYMLLSKIANVEIPRNSGDFRVMDRRVVDVVNSLPEHNRFLRGIYAWAGFRQEPFVYDRAARAAGSTKYSLQRMIRLSLDGILSFSMYPLRLLFMSGLGIMLFAFLAAVYLLALRILEPETFQAGVAGLFVAVLFLFGLNFMFLGVIGEYVGRVYSNGLKRPYVIIEDVIESKAEDRLESSVSE
jgi:dolichol-phosphate mannosyltransferase